MLDPTPPSRSLAQISRTLKSQKKSSLVTTPSAIAISTTTATPTSIHTWSPEADEKALKAVNLALSSPEGGDPFARAAMTLRKDNYAVDSSAVRHRYQTYLSPQAKLLRKTPKREWSIGERAQLHNLIDGQPMTRFVHPAY